MNQKKDSYPFQISSFYIRPTLQSLFIYPKIIGEISTNYCSFGRCQNLFTHFGTEEYFIERHKSLHQGGLHVMFNILTGAFFNGATIALGIRVP